MTRLELPDHCPEGQCLYSLTHDVAQARRSPAKRRALRTLAQGAVATGLSGAVEAVLAAVGNGADGRLILTTAVSAFAMSALAFLHRDKEAE